MNVYASLSEARREEPQALAFVERGDSVFAFPDRPRGEDFVYRCGGRLYVVAVISSPRSCPNGHAPWSCRCVNH